MRAPVTNLAASLTGLVVCESRKAKILYKLAKSLAGTRDARIKQLLALLHLSHDADLPVLKFFTTGFRQAVLRAHIWEASPLSAQPARVT